MDWTAILAANNIPEPPGRQEVIEQLALLKEAQAWKPSPDTVAAIKAAEGVFWLEIATVLKLEFAGQTVLGCDVNERCRLYGIGKHIGEKQWSSVYQTIMSKDRTLLTPTGGVGRSKQKNNKGAQYPTYRVRE